MAVAEISILLYGGLVRFDWRCNSPDACCCSDNASVSIRRCLHDGPVRAESWRSTADETNVNVLHVFACEQAHEIEIFRFYDPDYPGFTGLDECFVRDTAIWLTQSTAEFARSHRITNRVYKKNLTCTRRRRKGSGCNYLGIFC